MRWYRGGQRISVRQWPLLGLLLVVLFLSHDVLMASQAEATSLHQPGAAQHPSDDASAASGENPGIHHSAPDPDHPENCSIIQSGLFRSSDECDRVDHFAATLGGFTVSNIPQTTTDPVEWEEPHWSPGTLRAIFQVYRV